MSNSRGKTTTNGDDELRRARVRAMRACVRCVRCVYVGDACVRVVSVCVCVCVRRVCARRVCVSCVCVCVQLLWAMGQDPAGCEAYDDAGLMSNVCSSWARGAWAVPVAMADRWLNVHPP